MNHDNYFTNIHDFKFLLHTWSLSVLFLLYLIYKSGRPLHLTTVLMITSFVVQVITSNNTPLSFGFLFLRIWQFMVGTFVFNFEKKSDGIIMFGTSKKRLYFSILLLLVIVLLIPSNFSILRPIITVLTGLLIYYGDAIESKNFLTKLVAFVGDISYSIYLLHWPIIVLIKYHLIYHYQGLIFVYFTSYKHLHP